MIDDSTIEYEPNAEKDENGEYIEYIEEEVIPEEFSSEDDTDNGLADQPDTFYETTEDVEDELDLINAQEEVIIESEIINPYEETLMEARDIHTSSADEIISILTEALEKGEITAEQNASIVSAQEELINAADTIKSICDTTENEKVGVDLESIKDKMVGANINEILAILTDNGRKPWLYKDDDNNVLVDADAIPELTVLVNKFNLIATYNEDTAQFIVNPDFISMIVQGQTGENKTVKSVTLKYYLSTSGDELLGGEWVDELPPGDGYMWTKLITTYTDDTASEGEPTCLTGMQGPQGVPGVQGPAGATGATGPQGVSVQEVVIEYAKNTSTTTAPTTGWGTTMPSYQEGYYLWIRTRVKFSNSSTYSYSNPVCDQSWKANQEVYTQYKQLNDKFTWIVKSGTSVSNMQLTDKLFQLISETITLSAAHINLNGYINEGGNWSVDTNGNMDVQNLTVDGYLSVNDLRVGDVECSNLSKIVDADITLNVITSAVTGEANVFSDGAYWTSLQECLDAIPSMLSGHTVTIKLLSDISEDIDIRGFSGGRLNLYLNSKTINGSLYVRDNGARITVYGGSTTSAPATNAKIKPGIPLDILDGGISVASQSTTYFSLNYVDVYGKVHASNKTFYYAVASYDGATTYFKDGKIVGSDNAFVGQSGARLYVASSYGKVNNYVFSAKSGGCVCVNNDTQCTSAATTKTYSSTASQIVINSSFNKWDETTSTGTNDNTAASTKTVTYKSNYGDTYRSTVYNNWKKDNTVREGDYGYGDCNGCWFFGNQFSALKDKTITKVTIKITRQSGGTNAAITHTLVAHNHASRPSGSPSYISCYTQTFSLATGSSTTVTITNATVLNAIKAGTCKGFGLKSAYDSSHYSVCSGNATVIITYK